MATQTKTPANNLIKTRYRMDKNRATTKAIMIVLNPSSSMLICSEIPPVF